MNNLKCTTTEDDYINADVNTSENVTVYGVDTDEFAISLSRIDAIELANELLRLADLLPDTMKNPRFNA
jgi:hypothetical protein